VELQPWEARSCFPSSSHTTSSDLDGWAAREGGQERHICTLPDASEEDDSSWATAMAPLARAYHRLKRLSPQVSFSFSSSHREEGVLPAMDVSIDQPTQNAQLLLQSSIVCCIINFVPFSSCLWQ
jgi:hypothetical protein